MECPSKNVQQAVESGGLKKGTWVRAKDNRCGSYSLGGDRETTEGDDFFEGEKATRGPRTEDECVSQLWVRGGRSEAGTGVLRKRQN